MNVCTLFNSLSQIFQTEVEDDEEESSGKWYSAVHPFLLVLYA